MAEFQAFSPSPARVHDRARALIGHHPCWLRRAYCGGPYSIFHFRTCSYCCCAHPADLIDLLCAGGRLEESSKPGKFYLITPNPIAGDLVPIGSIPGRVFDGSCQYLPPGRRLAAPARAGLDFRPDNSERLAGHFERPTLEPAPAEIRWPFYSEHTTERQWADIWAAAKIGESNGPPFHAAASH
jgi:hypothetical protein